MASEDKNPPLVNDPTREAAASMRGYWAQVWRSVLAWMDLGESERLYLEGAEDFDRISGLAAETVQVKDVEGNVTLRSSGVIDAINNACSPVLMNPKLPAADWAFRWPVTSLRWPMSCRLPAATCARA